MTAPVIPPTGYARLAPEWMLRMDGGRPILYPLDDSGAEVRYLQPYDGLGLALLDGTRRFDSAAALWEHLVPGREPGDLAALVERIDRAVRARPSPRGFGALGAFDVATGPIAGGARYDPRAFVADPVAYQARYADVRTALRLAVPIAVTIAFTHRCPVSCAYCYAERPRVAELALSRWERLLDELVELGVMLVGLDNGDVFARPDGARFLELLIERDLLFTLSTKATVADGTVERLAAAGLARPVRGRLHRTVQLSVDSLSDEQLARLQRTRPGRAAGQLATFDAFVRRGVTPAVKTVLTGINADQVGPIVQTYREHGARVFTFAEYSRSLFRHSAELPLPPRAAAQVHERLEALRQCHPEITIRYVPADADRTSTAPGVAWPGVAPGVAGGGVAAGATGGGAHIGCSAGWTTLGIAADGGAFLCQHVPLTGEYLVGDAGTQSIREIWEGERLRRFIFPQRERFTGTACEPCADFEPCLWLHGRCYRDALRAYGSAYHPPPRCPRTPAMPAVSASATRHSATRAR